MVGKTGRSHPCFKKGFVIDKNGYRLVPVGDHPFPRRSYYMREHVKKIEAKIGRRLLRSECVHHRNGDIADNRIRNLRLMSKSAHSQLHRSA
jgi:hypothetical protein